MIRCLNIQLVSLLQLVADLSRLCKQTQLEYFKFLISTKYTYVLIYSFYTKLFNVF
jgi:hypothetical protein